MKEMIALTYNHAVFVHGHRVTDNESLCLHKIENMPAVYWYVLVLLYLV
jgi:hypothetical protein